MLRLVVRSALILVLTPALGAAGEAPRAKPHYEKGLAAYNAHDWPTAVRELELASSLEPRREYLFALGQAQRLAGDCGAAIVSYRAFVRASDNPQPKVEALIERCEGLLAASAPQASHETSGEPRAVEPRQEVDHEATPAPPALTPEPVTVTEVGHAEREVRVAAVLARPPPTRWHQDVAGGSMLVVGLVAAGIGAAVLATDQLPNPPFWAALSHADLGQSFATGTTPELAALASLAGGAVLIVGAIVRYLVVGLTTP